MKKVSIWSVIVVAGFILTMICAPALFAAHPDAEGGAWSIGTPTTPGFSGTEAIGVESGKVTKIETMPGVKDGLQMRFVTAQGAKWVAFMGPKWFMDSQKIKFAVGDEVEVRGKKFLSNIIATEISKGEWTMVLRHEEDGRPNWECCIPRKGKKEGAQ